MSDNVYEALRLRIMDHEIAPNARINIDRVAKVLDVSQTPVREALARLESEGLVDRVALRGYRAAPLLNRRALDELFSFRLMIEPWAAAKARMNQTPSTGDALAAAHGSIISHARRSGSAGSRAPGRSRSRHRSPRMTRDSTIL
jgi:DNA-binding GntR family transcriptional regulator